MNIFRSFILTLLYVLVLAGYADQTPEFSNAQENEATEPQVSEASWAYEGTTGSDVWGSLNDAYNLCPTGT